MIHLTNLGRAAVTELLTQQHYHFAWGGGNPTWAETDLSDLEQSSLTSELSRHRINVIGFVEPVTDGDIVVPAGSGTETYQRVVDPSNFLYLKAVVDANADVGAEIREYGIFLNPTLASTTPTGQMYLTAADIAEPGILLAYARCPVFTKDALTRREFEFVLPILGM